MTPYGVQPIFRGHPSQLPVWDMMRARGDLGDTRTWPECQVSPGIKLRPFNLGEKKHC